MTSLLSLFGSTLVAFIVIYTRCVGLDYPHAVVFDEVHYGSVCKLHLKKHFYVDRQPPLFNLIFCRLISTKFIRNHEWLRIGQEFSSDFNVSYFRMLPSVFGVLSILISYKIVKLLNFSCFAAYISSLLITFDNGLVLQSRLMLPDTFQHFLLLLCLYFGLKNTNATVLVSHIVLGLAISTHFSSFSLFPVILFLTFRKTWEICTNLQISFQVAFLKGFLYLISAFVVPFLVYFFVISLHVYLVSHNGPHTSLMSSAFQASLQDSTKSIQDVVTYGSYIHLRATDDVRPYGTCYLKSFQSTYPITYEDGRRSSAQQIISCCHKFGIESCWKVVHPFNSTIYGQPIFDNDIILLMHNQTGLFLDTTNVGAPVSKFRQEVSCINHKKADRLHLKWQVHLLNSRSTNKIWCNFCSYINLQHVETESYLTASGPSLPSWGQCNEIVGEVNNNLEFQTSSWNAEILEGNAPLSHQKCPYCQSMSLFHKTVEYILMSFNKGFHTRVAHRYSSYWYDWLFGSATIAYWNNSKTNSQLHFAANVVSWVGGLVLCMSLLCYYIFLAVCKQIQRPFILRSEYNKIQLLLCVLGSSWCLHVSYYIFSDELSLFVYQYLPSIIYLHILQACAVEVFCQFDSVFVFLFAFQYIFCVLLCYYALRPLTYGFPNTTKQYLGNIKIWNTWDLNI